jgi:hypothetical protein
MSRILLSLLKGTFVQHPIGKVHVVVGVAGAVKHLAVCESFQ